MGRWSVLERAGACWSVLERAGACWRVLELELECAGVWLDHPTHHNFRPTAPYPTLGTLLATTINVLRNRQVEMRACINKEVCELRLLRRAIFGMFGESRGLK